MPAIKYAPQSAATSAKQGVVKKPQGATAKQAALSRAVFSMSCPDQAELLAVFSHVKRREK